jgi:5-methylcytosine-specific restriction endonuclease McrA
MIVLNKAETIKNTYKKIHSENFSLFLPSIIKLNEFVYLKRRSLPLTRKNIFERDNNACQYCGSVSSHLTIDHIVPKQKGGTDNWENLVTCCQFCNNKKSNFLLSEINSMNLLKRPIQPHYLLYLQKYARNEYDIWKPYLFMTKN